MKIKNPSTLRLSSLLLLILLLATPAWSKPKSSAWLMGTWEATGYQIDTNETWTMKLSARRGKFSIEYPSLNCSGEWRLIAVTASRARFRERLKVGADKCTNNGRVVIEKLSRRQILFLYYNPGSREVTAHAVLTKQKAEGRRQKVESSRQ